MEWLQNILCIVFLFSIYENFVKKVMTASEPFCVLNHLNSLTYYKLVSYKKNSVLCKMQQRKLKYSLKKRKNSFHLLYVLKELRNFKRIIFVSGTKNRRKHNQHFKTAVFHHKFTLCHIKPNIYI